jgi:ornithine cyclodeaminase/alanine dehydrogenase-like protein (mu-crystallin family)
MWHEEQVRSVLCYAELIPAMRQALIDFSAGRVVQPVRNILPVTAHGGWFAAMAAVYQGVMGAKMVTFYPGNTGPEKHTHMAIIQLFDAQNGEPLAAMDGRLITEMRTAAISAIAIDHLAVKDAKVLAILGSGVQARSHFRALDGLRTFEKVKVWSRTEEHAHRFAREIGAEVTTAREAVSEADVVLAVTSSSQPIVEGKWMRPHAMVCAIGAATPDRRELDEEAMQGAIVVESREAALKEAGDIIQARVGVTAEIGELLNGEPLDRGNRPVVFKSVGMAVEDIAAAKLVYDRLREG